MNITAILVGLSILSLNQLAEHVAQAEVLSAEVAIILRGLHAIGASRVDVELPVAKVEEGLETTGMARF
jgi:hypothetical protein